MIINLHTVVEHQVKFLQIQVPIIHEEDLPLDIFGRHNNYLDWVINLDDDQIVDYSYFKEINIYLKVVDQGCYFLLNEKGQVICSLENEYVPCGLGEYGDYISFKIAPNGKISGYNKLKLLKDFEDRLND